MAVSSAWAAWSATGSLAPAVSARLDHYAYLAAWETSTVLATGDPRSATPSLWAENLRQALRLYRWTRLVWNPVPDLTDFWGSVYAPGPLSRDGGPFPDGRPSALPFPAGTDPALQAAAAQIWRWSGMSHLKYSIPHQAAIYGNVLVDLVDDLPGRKIYAQVYPPSYVRDLDLNAAGDVLFRSLAYAVVPDTGVPYTYREDISKTTIQTYRDDQPWDYSGDLRLGVARPNDWGFVPAVWVPHQPTHGRWADPASGPFLPELLAINSLLSMLDDAVMRGTKPIPWFATDGDISALFAGGKRASTADLSPEDGGREELTMFKLPPGTTAGKLDPSVDIAAVDDEVQHRMAAFLRHFPELSMWESLRARDVSGIAAEILHGDTRNKAIAIRGATDRQIEKWTQMAITMAATRLHAGSAYRWAAPDARHAVFAPFTATSYAEGRLDFTLADRPLIPAVPLAPAERTALAAQRLALGLDRAWVFGELGVPPDVITTSPAPPPPAPPEVPGAD